MLRDGILSGYVDNSYACNDLQVLNDQAVTCLPCYDILTSLKDSKRLTEVIAQGQVSATRNKWARYMVTDFPVIVVTGRAVSVSCHCAVSVNGVGGSLFIRSCD